MTKTVILNLRQSTQSIGGAEVVIRRTVGALDKLRYEVIIVCLKKPGMDLSAVLASLAGSGATLLELESRALLDVRALRQILKLIDKYQPHIVHCHDAKTDFIGFALRLLRPRQLLVTTMHGWVVASKRGALYKRLDQFFARFFHKAIAVSPLIEEQARAFGIRRATLIENGIPIDEWLSRVQQAPPLPFTLQPQERAVGFLGRLCREKGPLEFIETAAIVAAQNSDARFLVAGECPLLKAMKERAQQLNITPKCHFLGQLPLAMVPAFLTKLHVLLSTSETEGIPNALLEAAVLGVPIVASAVGGVPRVVAHDVNGFLAPYAAREQLAAHTLHLLTNEALHQRMSNAALARMREQFSIETTAARLSDLYQHLVGS